MNWSARGNVLNQYLRNTSIGTTVKRGSDFVIFVLLLRFITNQMNLICQLTNQVRITLTNKPLRGSSNGSEN